MLCLMVIWFLQKGCVAMATASAAPRVPPLWRNGNFSIFWVGQSLSVIGSAMANVAYPILVLEATGSVAQMGIVTAIESIGAMLASLFSGLLVDRVNRRALLVWVDSFNCLLYALLPLVWWGRWASSARPFSLGTVPPSQIS
jgi:MFS family permease